MGICNVCGGWGWGGGDGVHLGDHSWDTGGDVARSEGDGCGGNWVHWIHRDRHWVCWGNIGGGGAWGGAVGIDNWGRLGVGSAGVGLARAVGHLRSAGSDGVNDGGGLILVR